MATIMQHRLNLEITKRVLPYFFPVLSAGFKLMVSTGCSVRSLLCRQLGIPHDYAENRIQTIFLNGVPIDNAQHTVVKAQDTLALSASLPGLAGHIMRKHGKYAAMRTLMTPFHEPATTTGGQQAITLKLFNVVAGDLASHFLVRGIRIRENHLTIALTMNPPRFQSDCLCARLDGTEISATDLMEMKWNHSWIKLQAKVR